MGNGVVPLVFRAYGLGLRIYPCLWAVKDLSMVWHFFTHSGLDIPPPSLQSRMPLLSVTSLGHGLLAPTALLAEDQPPFSRPALCARTRTQRGLPARPSWLSLTRVDCQDYSQVNMLGLRYTSVSFGVGASLGSPNR